VAVLYGTTDPAPAGEYQTSFNLAGGITWANVWVTEKGADGSPHIGSAIFRTSSVQFEAQGQGCRVTWSHDYHSPLSALFVITFG
jgi:hypothetical protein